MKRDAIGKFWSVFIATELINFFIFVNAGNTDKEAIEIIGNYQSTNEAFIEKFLLDPPIQEDLISVNEENYPNFYWAENSITDEDYSSICGSLWSAEAEYNETYEFSKGKTLLKFSPWKFHVEYLKCVRITGHATYVTVPIPDHNGDQKLTILDEMNDGFVINVSQDALSETMPIMRMFALQTGGIKLSSDPEYDKAVYLRSNANWIKEGPVIDEALTGICHSYFNFSKPPGKLISTEFKMGKLFYRYDKDPVEAQLLNCTYDSRPKKPYYKLGVKNKNNITELLNIVWIEEFRFFAIEGFIMRTVRYRKIVDYFERNPEKSNIIWSTDAIPEESMHQMCINAVKSLKGDFVVNKHYEISEGQIKFEPYSENRPGQILQCTYKNREHEKVHLDVVPVIYKEKTVYAELVKVGNLYQYAGPSPDGDVEYNKQSIKVKEMFASVYSSYNNAEKLLEFDKHVPSNLTADLKCLTTMKYNREDDYRSYLFKGTVLRKKLILTPHTMQSKGFHSRAINTNIIFCEMYNRTFLSTSYGILNPFDKSMLTPVQPSNSNEDIYLLSEGVELYQRTSMKIMFDKKFLDDKYDFQYRTITGMKYPLLKRHLLKLCLKHRGFPAMYPSPTPIELDWVIYDVIYLQPVARGVSKKTVYECKFLEHKRLNVEVVMSQLKVFRIEKYMERLSWEKDENWIY